MDQFTQALGAHRVVSVLHKLAWGVRAVGLGRTVRGVARLAALKVRRPQRSQVRLRSGGTISFENPSQRAPALVVFGDVIDPELFLVRRVLLPGAIVVDAGAAIGQFTVVAGQTPGTTIHAYEPSSANLPSLRRNAELNGLADRVVVHHAALSHYEGTANFRTTSNAFLSQLSGDCQDLGSETVPVLTLTDELRRLQIEHVDILKVNVAGYEREVLEGAMPLFARGSVTLVVVLIGTAVIPVLQRIATFDYRFFFFDPYAAKLHEIARIDEQSLHAPPTPARHVIGIHAAALASGPLSQVAIVASRGRVDV